MKWQVKISMIKIDRSNSTWFDVWGGGDCIFPFPHSGDRSECCRSDILMPLPLAVGFCRGIDHYFTKYISGQQRNVGRTMPLYSHPRWWYCGVVKVEPFWTSAGIQGYILGICSVSLAGSSCGLVCCSGLEISSAKVWLLEMDCETANFLLRASCLAASNGM